MGERYDVVIFGATGFTGTFVVQELMESLKESQSNKTFAVAGRNEAKLKSALKEVQQRSGLDTSEVPIIIADVSKIESIDAMTKRAKVVINAVGPYAYFGEQVVRSCVENGASHVDISGEPIFLEGMQVKYAKQAEEAGVYIIGSCGFDSIPTDLGVVYLMQQFNGDLNSAESVVSNEVGPHGATVNIGTWRSLINGVATFGNTTIAKEHRAALFPKPMPKPAHKLSFRSLFRDPERYGWCVPFPSCDRSVVKRTQYYLWEKKNMRPVQMGCYINLGSPLWTLACMLYMSVLFFACRIKFLRNYMEERPSLFSFGKFTREGPTLEQIKGQRFKVTLTGQGWKDKLSEPTDTHATPPDTTMVVEVDGPDAGYVGTSICLVQSALTVLDDRDKLPKKGGVFTPGAAFIDTGFIERARKRGVTFSVKRSTKALL